MGGIPPAVAAMLATAGEAGGTAGALGAGGAAGAMGMGALPEISAGIGSGTAAAMGGELGGLATPSLLAGGGGTTLGSMLKGGLQGIDAVKENPYVKTLSLISSLQQPGPPQLRGMQSNATPVPRRNIRRIF
jgi:hypothetical protein